MRAKDSEREGCEGMAGTICPADGDRGRTLPASLLVATVVDLLAMHIQSGRRSDSAEFSDLCFALARFCSSSVYIAVKCIHLYMFLERETVD